MMVDLSNSHLKAVPERAGMLALSADSDLRGVDVRAMSTMQGDPPRPSYSMEGGLPK